MINDKIYKEYVINEVALLIQFVLVFFLIVFGILSLFEKNFGVCLELILGITMFVMAYNNEKTFKRKIMTVPYIVIGVVSVTVSLMQYIGIFI